jgi:hypothetical protein
MPLPGFKKLFPLSFLHDLRKLLESHPRSFMSQSASARVHAVERRKRLSEP